jgi:hypothetical protein
MTLLNGPLDIAIKLQSKHRYSLPTTRVTILKNSAVSKVLWENAGTINTQQSCLFFQVKVILRLIVSLGVLSLWGTLSDDRTGICQSHGSVQQIMPYL